MDYTHWLPLHFHGFLFLSPLMLKISFFVLPKWGQRQSNDPKLKTGARTWSMASKARHSELVANFLKKQNQLWKQAKIHAKRVGSCCLSNIYIAKIPSRIPLLVKCASFPGLFSLDISCFDDTNK